jgi:hypothetical protein
MQASSARDGPLAPLLGHGGVMQGTRLKAVLLNDTRVDRHHGSSTVVESLYRLCARAGIDILAAAPAHADWRHDAGVMAAMPTASLIIVNGEGTIHHDRPAGKWLLEAGTFARASGRRAALVNTTWQANGPPLFALARAFDLVAVRETASAAELAVGGIAARVVPDFALYHEPAASPARSGIGYTDCVVGPRALDIYRRMWRAGAEPLSMYHDYRGLRHFAQSVRRFLPGRSLFDPMLAIAALRGALVDRSAQLADREELLRNLASKELIVTGRFHMLIFAMATRTPFLAVESNTHKLGATLADSGLAAWRHVQPGDLNPATLRRAARWVPGEQERLEAFVDSGRAAMERLFEDLAGVSRAAA